MDKKGVMSLAIIAFLVLGQSNSTRAIENPLCYAQCLTCLYGGPLATVICSVSQKTITTSASLVVLLPCVPVSSLEKTQRLRKWVAVPSLAQRNAP
ncbi:unnamed protein product [Prunus armeniaca]